VSATGLFKVTFFDPEESGIGTETHNVLAEDGERAIAKARAMLFQSPDKGADQIPWKLCGLSVIGWED